MLYIHKEQAGLHNDLVYTASAVSQEDNSYVSLQKKITEDNFKSSAHPTP